MSTGELAKVFAASGRVFEGVDPVDGDVEAAVRNERGGGGRPTALRGVRAVATGAASETAAIATARAAGAKVQVVKSGDPGRSAEHIRSMAAMKDMRAVAIGPGFASADQAAYKIRAVSTDVQLPGGGQVVFPGRRMIRCTATRAAGKDGNYSNEVDVAKLRPWVEAAHKAGMYVVLDLQPGRSNFLTRPSGTRACCGSHTSGWRSIPSGGSSRSRNR